MGAKICNSVTKRKFLLPFINQYPPPPISPESLAPGRYTFVYCALKFDSAHPSLAFAPGKYTFVCSAPKFGFVHASLAFAPKRCTFVYCAPKFGFAHPSLALARGT